MTPFNITYAQPFSLLVSLGFEEVFNEGRVEDLPRTFVHSASDTVLLYRRPLEMTVSPADLLSTETRLQMNGISDESLRSLIDSVAASKS